MKEVRQKNKRNQEALHSQLSQLKPPTKALAQTTDFSQIRCFTCGGMGHISEICRRRQATGSAGERLCYECQQLGHLAKDCPARRARTTDEAVQGAFVVNRALRNNSKEEYIELEIGGQQCVCLLDTESDVTLFPAPVVKGYQLRESDIELLAANGARISSLEQSW